jgi:hypothetical protein
MCVCVCVRVRVCARARVCVFIWCLQTLLTAVVMSGSGRMIRNNDTEEITRWNHSLGTE